jgi:hypothetical protein
LAGFSTELEVVVPAYFPGWVLEHEEVVVAGLEVLSIELEILNFEIVGS